AKAKKARASAPAKVVIAWEERLKSNDLTKARKYSPKESFAVDEVMNHPTFGYGIVSAVRGDKIDVAFKAFEKTLLQKRPDGLAARPSFQVPKVVQAPPGDEPAAEGSPSTPDGGSGSVAS